MRAARRDTSLARKKYKPKPPAEIRRNMAAIRSGENATERALRRAIHALGLRYRKYSKYLAGRPDITFSGSRVVVFVDGDYWHARELVEGRGAELRRRLRRLASPSRQYWSDKFRRRVARDREITTLLESQGWRVLRLWESDVRSDVPRAAQRIAACVRRRVVCGADPSREASPAKRRDRSGVRHQCIR